MKYYLVEYFERQGPNCGYTRLNIDFNHNLNLSLLMTVNVLIRASLRYVGQPLICNLYIFHIVY